MRKLVGLSLSISLSASLLVGCSSMVEPEQSELPSAAKSAEIEETQAAEPEPLPTFEVSELRVDSELCKFEDVTEDFARRKPWQLINYFPNVVDEPYFLPTVGEINVGLVLLDWTDKQGTLEDEDYYLGELEMMAKWFERVSQGKLSLNFRISENWSTLNGSWQDYRRDDNDGGGDEERAPWEQWLLDEAVMASDDTFDYSDIDLVLLAIPRSGEVYRGSQGQMYSDDTVMTSGTQGMAYDVHEDSLRATVIRSNEGSIGNWVISGTQFQHDDNTSTAWIHWAHELGHMFGFISHMNQPVDGANSPIYNNSMYGVGLFADQWIVTRVEASWNAWLAGWLDDDQIWCVDASEVKDEVFSLNDFRDVDGNVKSVIIRTSDTSGLVIESRKWNGEFDYSTAYSDKGFYDAVVMYNIDSSRWIADSSMVALVPETTNETWDEGKWPPDAASFTDIYFHEGQVAEFEGLSIEVLSLQESANFIRVKRVDG